MQLHKVANTACPDLVLEGTGGNLKPLFDKLSILLPELIASRQRWSVTLTGRGATIDLDISRGDSVIVRPPDLSRGEAREVTTKELVLSR